MSLMRLNSLRSCLTRRNLSQCLVTYNNRRTFKTEKCPTSTIDNSNNNDDEDNQPVQYSTSPAATWLAEHSQKGDKDDAPWFQPIIISLSAMIFLVYFCMLREPNDIDKIFDMELGDHFNDVDMDALKKSAGIPVDVKTNIK